VSSLAFWEKPKIRNQTLEEGTKRNFKGRRREDMRPGYDKCKKGREAENASMQGA